MAVVNEDRGFDSPGMDEQALVAALRAGDEAAYEQLVRAFGSRMLAVAMRILRCEEDAQDAVQTAYLSAFRSLNSFEGGCRLSTWLHRIVVNAALMKLRSRRRRPEESIELLLPTFLDDGHHAETFSRNDLPADGLLEREETRAAVRACIAQLPEHHRSILVMRDIEDVSTAEVAALLGITPNAVKIRLHRARQALATLLRREFKTTSPGAGMQPKSSETVFPRETSNGRAHPEHVRFETARGPRHAVVAR
jgi:RNA polymerase sigma-70 factor (ECF subfamily)